MTPTLAIFLAAVAGEAIMVLAAFWPLPFQLPENRRGL